MKKTFFLMAFAAGTLMGTNSCNNSSPSNTTTNDSATVTKSATTNTGAENLRTAMRKLWEDHITFTRNVICCIVDDLPGADQAVKRLLKNQDDIGDAIKPYYGDDAGKKLSALLHEHINISADVVRSAKANNKTALDSANKKWYDNAD